MPEEIVQGSALLWPYLPLGPTSLLVLGHVLLDGSKESIWVLSGGFVFVWSWVFYGGISVLAGVIDQGARIIMSVAAPGDNVLAGDGACFVRRGRSERLRVEWCFFFVRVWYFPRVEKGSLPEELVQGSALSWP